MTGATSPSTPRPAPTCCGQPMHHLFEGVGFSAWWCPACETLADVFACCGHRHTPGEAEAASYICHGCGVTRGHDDPHRFPTPLGETTLREIALVGARRTKTRGAA